MTVCAIKNRGQGRQPMELGSPIALTTVYLQHPIRGFHGISLVGILGGAGSLLLDTNRCRLNEFGDSAACSEASPVVRAIRIMPKDRTAPTALGRAIYSIENNGLHNRLHLVVGQDGYHCRLVYDDRGLLAPRPITLERLVWTGQPGSASVRRIELGEARYTAKRRPDESVLLTATGTRPAGYRAFLHRLPSTEARLEFQLLQLTAISSESAALVPFVALATFDSKHGLESLTVHDAAGQTSVLIEQVSDPQ